MPQKTDSRLEGIKIFFLFITKERCFDVNNIRKFQLELLTFVSYSKADSTYKLNEKRTSKKCHEFDESKIIKKFIITAKSSL